METKNKKTILLMIVVAVVGISLGYFIGFVQGIEYTIEKGVETIDMLDIEIDNLEVNINESLLVEEFINQSERNKEFSSPNRMIVK